MSSDGLVTIRLDSIRCAGYRHPPFGPAYRPFFEGLSRALGEVYPCPPEEWEDGFRHDLHPESEMAIWRDIARLYADFTRGKKMTLARKHDIFMVLLGCASAGPELGLRHVNLTALSRPEARRLAERAHR